MTIYLYALLCPAGNIRYIGKTNNPHRRFIQHLSAARRGANVYRSGNWIRSILRRGEKPTMRIMHEVLPGEDWQECERDLIAACEEVGINLTNTAEGGEGGFSDDPDKVAERVTKARKTKATAEYKERTKDSWKAPWRDPDRHARHKEAMLRAAKRPETIARRKAAGKEIASRPGVLSKRSAKMKAHYPNSKLKEMQSSEWMKEVHRKTLAKRWAVPGAREALSEEMRSPERQAAMKAGLTPEVRAARLAKATETLRKPENRKAASEKAKAQWQDPAYLEAKRLEIAKRNAPKHTPEHRAMTRDRRNAKKREKRAAEDPVSKELRLAERRAQRKAAKLAEPKP